MDFNTQRFPSSLVRLAAPVISATLLVLLILGLNLAEAKVGTVRVPTTAVLTRITTASDVFRQSATPSVSADGTRIVFASDSDFLGQGIPAQQQEIWLYDTITQQLTRVTTATDTNRYSATPHISADGLKIAFASDADLSLEGIPNDQNEIWLYDVVSRTLTRVTTASDVDRDSHAPVLNADATQLTFFSDSDFSGDGIPAGQREIWAYDFLSETFTRITHSPQSDRQSVTPRMSADGARIVFASDADFLGEGIAKEMPNIWLYDSTTMTVTRITTGTNDTSYWPSISADGTLIAYNGSGKFWDPGTLMGLMEVWLYDTTTAHLTRVTTASHPILESHLPSISADGTTIAFASMEDFTGQTTPDGNFDVWLYDVATATYTRVTSGTESFRNSDYVALNGDGSVLVFHSNADLLNQGMPASQTEIWHFERHFWEYRIYIPVVAKTG